MYCMNGNECVSDDLEDVFTTIKDGLAAGLRQSRVGHEISSATQVFHADNLITTLASNR